MAKSTRSRSPRRGRGLTGQIRIGAPPQPRAISPDLSREARRRLAMIDWHRAHGANVSLAARHFGLARPTVYRWLAALTGTASRPSRTGRPRHGGGAGRPRRSTSSGPSA